MHKVKGTQLIAGSVTENYKESVKRLFSNHDSTHVQMMRLLFCLHL